MGNSAIDQVKTLDDAKSFGCLSFECASGSVHVPKGTKSGTIIKHDCGSQGILSHSKGAWSLVEIGDPSAPEISGELKASDNDYDTVQQESEVSVDQQQTKKRGRPKGSKNKAKVNGAAPVENTPVAAEVSDVDTNIMRNVEADCPHDVNSPEGQEWCSTEFDKRKGNVEAKTQGEVLPPAPKKRGRKKHEEVVSDLDQFGKEFISEAKQSDKRIDKALVRGGESFFEAIKELVGSGEKGYYKALGFKTFDSYRESKTAYSRSHIGQGIQAYKALHGKVSDEQLATIPIPTAILLTKVSDSKLTQEVFDLASSMKIQDFKEKKYPELMSQLVDATTGEPQAITPEEFAWVNRLRVHKQVADRWKDFFEVAKWKATGLTDENDVYGNFTIDEKALLVISLECSVASGWNAEYQEWKQQQATPATEEPAF